MEWSIRCFIPERGKRFYLLREVQTDCGVHPPSWWLILGLKRPERHVDYSPPSIGEVTNQWSCTCIFPSSPCLRDMDRDKFLFCFPFLQVKGVVWLNSSGHRRVENAVFSRRCDLIAYFWHVRGTGDWKYMSGSSAMSTGGKCCPNFRAVGGTLQ
jgi:hypothetical protein